MFDSLDDAMKKDFQKEGTPRQRMLMYLAIAVASILLIGGLYVGVRLIEG